MIQYFQVSKDEELEQILALQQKNLPVSLSNNEKEKEGFVTVEHDFEVLKKMNELEPHIIAKKDDEVVGYALSMVSSFKNDIEVLKSMFDKIDNLLDPKISYIVMGQICIDKAHRKKGIFKGLYHKMRLVLQSKYQVLITEVDDKNTRSLNAHYAVGFKDLALFESKGVNWRLICWEWC